MFHFSAPFFSVPPQQISTPLLDTSSQRSKAQLSRRRNRSRPSRSFRTGAGQTDELKWSVSRPTGLQQYMMFFSSKEKKIWHWLSQSVDSLHVFAAVLMSFSAEKEAQNESDSEEEQPKPKVVVSPVPPTQKVSMFPGMSPASLLVRFPPAQAQLYDINITKKQWTDSKILGLKGWAEEEKRWRRTCSRRGGEKGQKNRRERKSKWRSGAVSLTALAVTSLIQSCRSYTGSTTHRQQGRRVCSNIG